MTDIQLHRGWAPDPAECRDGGAADGLPERKNRRPQALLRVEGVLDARLKHLEEREK
jgi:hypothetical protein